MKFLLENTLAPLTFSWGFLDFPMPAVADIIVSWRESHTSVVEALPVSDPLQRVLRHLEPLRISRDRELILATASPWTAYFDNGARMGDPASAVGHLSKYRMQGANRDLYSPYC